MRRFVLLGSLLAMLCWCGSALASETGEIFLVGTDAVSFHGDSAFGGQLASNLGSSIAYVNDFGGGGGALAGSSVTSFSSLPSSLAGFSGLFIASPGSCCSDPMTDGSLGIQGAAAAAEMSAFVAGGGNLVIEDFSADSGWTSFLGFDPSVSPVGFGGDPGIPTAHGVSEGFTGNGRCGVPGQYCDFTFGHQDYNNGFYAGHGFFPLITSSGDGGRAIVLESENGTVPETPEPTTLVLLGSGLLGLIAKKRKS